MPECEWKPDFTWHKIEINAYKFIFEQAVKKHEEFLSESESITNKAIKMIVALVVMFSFFVNFIVQQKIPIGYNAVFFILFIIVVVAVMSLIAPKEVKTKGFVPSELLPKELDSDADKGLQEHLLYYSAICKLENDIQIMRVKNKERARQYKLCLIASIVLFSVGAIIIIAAIMNYL